MNAYGKIALAAVSAIRNSPSLSPKDAWMSAATAAFPDKKAAREKVCPKSTFLGLCQAGKVVGINAGAYTASTLNLNYALRASQMLANSCSPDLSPSELWQLVISPELKSHNSQMDVVLALWHSNLIR